MAVPTVITDVNVSAASNSPTGGESIGTNADDYIRAHAAFIAQLRDGSKNMAVTSVGVPAAAFVSDPNTGLGSSAADKVALIAGSVAAIVAETTGVSVTGVVNATGLIFGRGGGIGMGRLTISTSAASGGADGDIHFRYSA
jgi:hypothetical protein